MRPSYFLLYTALRKLSRGQKTLRKCGCSDPSSFREEQVELDLLRQAPLGLLSG